MGARAHTHTHIIGEQKRTQFSYFPLGRASAQQFHTLKYKKNDDVLAFKLNLLRYNRFYDRAIVLRDFPNTVFPLFYRTQPTRYTARPRHGRYKLRNMDAACTTCYRKVIFLNDLSLHYLPCISDATSLFIDFSA